MTSRNLPTAGKAQAAKRENVAQGFDVGSRPETNLADDSRANRTVGFTKTKGARVSRRYGQVLKQMEARLEKKVRLLKSDTDNVRRRLDALAVYPEIVKDIAKITPEPVLSKKLDPSRSRGKALPREVLTEYGASRADRYYSLFCKKADR